MLERSASVAMELDFISQQWAEVGRVEFQSDSECKLTPPPQPHSWSIVVDMDTKVIDGYIVFHLDCS